MCNPPSHFRRTLPISQPPTIQLPADSLHELNNKLATIVTHCHLMSANAQADDGTKRHVEVIRKAANEISKVMAKLVNG